MQGSIYILCALTALACCIMLLRGWLRRRVRLLLWCSVFFLTLTFENVILFIDVVMAPQIDLSPVRNSVALAGVILFLFGLTWDTK